MKRVLFAVLLATLLVPSVSFADHWRYRPRHDYYRHYPRRTVVVDRRHNYNGAAIAAGVLGGLATGIIIDRLLIGPPQPAYAYQPPPPPAYDPPPPPPRSRDPYDAGYSEGYGRGVEKGRYERYEQGKRRGYEEGYEDARSGRAY